MSSQANASGSAGLHRTACTTGVKGAVTAFGYYNIGILNEEVKGNNWNKKMELTKNDIRDFFESPHGMQVLMVIKVLAHPEI